MPLCPDLEVAALSRFALVLLPLLVAGILLAVGPSVAADADGDAMNRRLAAVRADKDPEAWREAIDALRAGTPEAQARLGKLLRKMGVERFRTWRKLEDKVRALASGMREGKKAARRRKAWEKARASAHDWLFDEVRFPVPAEALITGPKEGYEEARRRGDACIAAYKRLERELDACLAPMLRLSSKDAIRMRKARQAAKAAYARIAAELGEAEGLAPDRCAEALLALRCGESDLLVDAFDREKTSWRRLCLFAAWCRHVTAYNEAHPCGMRPDARRGLECLNAYRVSLGIGPVRYDARLIRSAAKHSEEMTKLGYFSHRSPVKGRKTKRDRARLEGYAHPVVECITGVGGGQSAIDFWKYDGGHHRDMIDPKWVEGGFGTQGPAVYVGGQGDEGSWPVLTATGG